MSLSTRNSGRTGDSATGTDAEEPTTTKAGRAVSLRRGRGRDRRDWSVLAIQETAVGICKRPWPP